MDQAALMPTRHKLDADSYYRAAATGVLKPDERVELIAGAIIDMAPIGPDHEGDVIALNRALVEACGRRALVSPQNSLRLGRWSAPQPDFTVLRPRADLYRKGERAGPADALLVIEVSDSSLHYDRMVKLPMYARAGICEVWILDVAKRVVTSHRDPSADGYSTVSTHLSGETIALAQDPTLIVKLDLD